MKISKTFEMSCSHRLNDATISDVENKAIFGKCNNPPSHGHNYIVEVILKGTSSDMQNGMLVNFSDVKKVFLSEIDKQYDHQNLNECEPFKTGGKYQDTPILTTAENMCMVFFDILKKHLPKLHTIKIWETSTCYAEYSESDM